MPLLDHADLEDEVQWGTFHHNWVVKMVDRLNEVILSARYKSESHTYLGQQAEVDIATLERNDGGRPHGPDGGIAVAEAVYAPPAPPLSGTVGFTDGGVFEVLVRRGRWDLVAAVELVSESNKDRPDTRRAFAAKCANYLHAGVSVVVVDVVTARSANLHAELCDLLDLPAAFDWSSPSRLSALCYRTVQGVLKPGMAVGNGKVRLDVWPFPLTIGVELPTVPLWLAADLAVPLELELTYAAACKSLRLG